MWHADYEAPVRTRRFGTILIVSACIAAALLAVGIASRRITPELGATESAPVERQPVTDGLETSRLYAVMLGAQLAPPRPIASPTLPGSEATPEPATELPAQAPAPRTDGPD